MWTITLPIPHGNITSQILFRRDAESKYRLKSVGFFCSNAAGSAIIGFDDFTNSLFFAAKFIAGIVDTGRMIFNFYNSSHGNFYPKILITSAKRRDRLKKIAIRGGSEPIDPVKEAS